MNEKKRQKLLKEIGIEKIENKLRISDWLEISRSGNLSEEFIREFQGKLRWGNLSICQKMSENFIREFSNKVEWKFISNYQQMSESFIREFNNEVDWLIISRKHTLSDEFIEEFKEKIRWKLYLQEKYVKYDIIKKNIFRTNIKNIDEFKTLHLNKKQKRDINKLLKLKQIFN
jgi:hypothetical protein